MRTWKVKWRFVILTLLILAALYTGLRMDQQQRLEAQKAADQEQQRLYMAKNQRNLEMNKQLNYVQSDAYFENAAREMGYTKEGEITFCFDDPEALTMYTNEEWLEALELLRE